MKINKKDFPPIKVLTDNSVDIHCPFFEVPAVMRTMLARLLAEGRKNIFTVSKNIEKMAAENGGRLIDYYLKNKNTDDFSGAFVDTSMQSPSIEVFKFLPPVHGKWIDGERDDIYTYLFASFQGKKKTGDVILVAAGIIQFIFEDEEIKTKMRGGCPEGDEMNCILYMKFLFYLNVFLKYADKEVVTVYGKQKKTLPDKSDFIDNKSGTPIKYIDSRWLREIIRLEGFKVKGHFRLQPCKDETGEWTRKIIYINEFEKHGYHRRAQRDIDESENK